jgi:hypothetical protein
MNLENSDKAAAGKGVGILLYEKNEEKSRITT